MARQKGFRGAFIRFLLKNYFFNPKSNPIFFIFLILCIILIWSGDLNKAHAVLLPFFFVFSHYFMGNPFRETESQDSESSKSPFKRYFQYLPLSQNRVFGTYLVTAAIYFIIVFVIMIMPSLGVSGLPSVDKPQITQKVTEEGDTILVLTGYIYDKYRLQHAKKVSVALDKSFIFTIAANAKRGFLLLCFAYCMIVFFYLTIFQVFKQTIIRVSARIEAIIHQVPLLFFLGFGPVIALEILLPGKAISSNAGFFLEHWHKFEVYMAVISVITLLSALLMCRRITVSLKEVC
jgi:hypothetical protein